MKIVDAVQRLILSYVFVGWLQVRKLPQVQPDKIAAVGCGHELSAPSNKVRFITSASASR